jgi:DNA-binding NtrC family response regulator
MTHVVIVDDEPNVLRSLQRMCLNPLGSPDLPADLKVTTFEVPAVALEHLAMCAVDLVISDYRMPLMDGATFLTHVKKLQPDTVGIILSANTDMDGITRALNDAGIFRFVAKPWNDVELRTLIAEILAERRLFLENRQLADELRAQTAGKPGVDEELARLEAESPGITKVRWSEDGGVLLEE